MVDIPINLGSTCAPLNGGPFNFRGTIHVIINDVGYRWCWDHEVMVITDLQNNLNVHPIDSNSLSDGFVTSTQLDCSEPLDGCAWRNEQSANQLNWYVASFKAPNDPNVKSTFTRLTGGRSELPSITDQTWPQPGCPAILIQMGNFSPSPMKIPPVHLRKECWEHRCHARMAKDLWGLSKADKLLKEP